MTLHRKFKFTGRKVEITASLMDQTSPGHFSILGLCYGDAIVDDVGMLACVMEVQKARDLVVEIILWKWYALIVIGQNPKIRWGRYPGL